jgi:hemoglobin
VGAETGTVGEPPCGIGVRPPAPLPPNDRNHDPMNGSLFERLGGFARVRLIISDFYDRVLESERLAVHFRHIDMRRLVDHQTKFIAAIMGGPASFTDEQISRAHARFGITMAEFEEMTGLLRETLEDFDVAEADIARVLVHVESMRAHVVTGASVAGATL